MHKVFYFLLTQALYGKNKKQPPPSKPSKPSDKDPASPDNAICSNKKIDAITTMSDGKTYVFIGTIFMYN